MTYKTIIIDDEPLARNIIEEYVKKHNAIQIVAQCANGFEAFKAIQEHQPHLIFLDIQMPKINGFELLELLDTKPAIIFTTAHDEYALKAFETNSIDYLLKPIAQHRFDTALQKFFNQQFATTQHIDKLLSQPINTTFESNRIVVKQNAAIKIIPTTAILYLEAYDDYVKIHTIDGLFVKKQTLSYYEKSLSGKEFVRIHRSFIVPISTITKVEPYEKGTYKIWLKNGTELPMSKTGYTLLKEVLKW